MSVDVERILLEIETLPKTPQICLQGVKPFDDPLYGIGKVLDLKHNENEFVHPNFNIPYTNSILNAHNMFRSRLMRLKPKHCYTYHFDPSKRLHIPLLTNEKCMFIIEDEVFRYPADGNVYLIDTTKMHTAINASTEERIHIVGCV